MTESRLDLVRARYGATPREIDDQLGQLARGDRGCAWLAASGVGVLITFAVALISLTGLVSFSWAYVGVALWIGATAMGARAQAASEKLRRLALAEAPLLAARVVIADPYLLTEGRRSGRALVAFAPEDVVLDGDSLRRAAERARVHEHDALAILRADRFGAGVRDASEFGLKDPVELTWIAVDPLRLPGHKLDEAHAELALIVDVSRGVIEHV